MTKLSFSLRSLSDKALGLNDKRRRTLLALYGIALLSSCSRALHSKKDSSPPHFDPHRRIGTTLWDQGLPGYQFEQWRLPGQPGKLGYRLWLAIPAMPAPAHGYPLLCMLDGNAVADSLRAEDLMPWVAAGHAPVIAALGPDSDFRVDVAQRSYDYTPPIRQDGPTWDDETHGRLGGGADQFLDLWSDTILPRLEARVKTDPQRKTLWGHSYGGLFALHTLLRRPSLFNRYATADASLWWQDGFILREAEHPAPLPSGTETSLLFMQESGAHPTRKPAAGADLKEMARMQALHESVPPDSGERLVAQLRAQLGLHAEFQAFPGLTHGEMLAATIAPALAFATRPVR